MRFTRPASLTQLPYASLLYYWGFLLPCRELCGFLTINVDTLECFSVKIRQSHEPVIMFATPVLFASRDLAFGRGDFAHGGPIVIRFLGIAVVSFRRGSRVRFHQAHSHARHPADNVRLARIGEPSNLAPRVGIRNGEQMAFADFTPTAKILIS